MFVRDTGTGAGTGGVRTLPRSVTAHTPLNLVRQEVITLIHIQLYIRPVLETEFVKRLNTTAVLQLQSRNRQVTQLTCALAEL